MNKTTNKTIVDKFGALGKLFTITLIILGLLTLIMGIFLEGTPDLYNNPGIDDYVVHYYGVVLLVVGLSYIFMPKRLRNDNLFIGVLITLTSLPVIFYCATEFLVFSPAGLLSFWGIVSSIALILGIIQLKVAIQHIIFRKKINLLREVLEKFHSTKGVDISSIAKELTLSEAKTLRLIERLMYFGYVNRIAIDYQKAKINYLASASADGNDEVNFINIKCSSCGGTNHVRKGVNYSCEYCGAENLAQGTSQELILVTENEESQAERLSAEENLSSGCLVPFALLVYGGMLVMFCYGIFTISSDGYFMDRMRSDTDLLTKIIDAVTQIAPAIFLASIVGFIVYKLSKEGINSILIKQKRAIAAKYVPLVLSTRTPEGVELRQIANIMKEQVEIVQKHLQSLIDSKILLGVSLNLDTKKLIYVDDDAEFDRFVDTKCQNCGGEFVATYGIANKCPYCGNGVDVSKN